MNNRAEVPDPDDLLLQFQSITTNDHESLINQFSKVLQIDPKIASFFLESSNWNVETAMNNYLNSDTQILDETQPAAVFISDLSQMQQIKFAPEQVIPMIWSFRNVGSTPWPHDIALVHADGHELQTNVISPITSVGPTQQCDVQIQILAPSTAGTYAANWRLSGRTGYFGDPVWIIVNVEETTEVTMDL